MNNGDINAKDLERIRRFKLIDDEFMSVCFKDNIECTELVVRIILDRTDIKVKEVHVQHQLKNLQGRSVMLDIYAVDAENKRYNIEVQRAAGGALPMRARYNSSLMDGSILRKNDKTDKLPETYVIFITEHDVLKGNQAIYHIDRTIKECNHRSFNDGSHIIYVNAGIRSKDALGRLMEDFFCDDPDKMNYKVLADRTRQFKENTKGVRNMNSVVDEIREEGRAMGIEEGKKEGIAETSRQTAIRMLKLGKLSYEDITVYTDLPMNEILKLAEQLKDGSIASAKL